MMSSSPSRTVPSPRTLLTTPRAASLHRDHSWTTLIQPTDCTRHTGAASAEEGGEWVWVGARGSVGGECEGSEWDVWVGVGGSVKGVSGECGWGNGRSWVCCNLLLTAEVSFNLKHTMSNTCFQSGPTSLRFTSLLVVHRTSLSFGTVLTVCIACQSAVKCQR